MNIAYVRVSSYQQNEFRQVKELKKYNIEKWFTEKISAKDTNRPQLKAMLEFAREGDTIYIKDFSRLARSTKDLLDLVEKFQKKKIHLKSIKENLDTSTSTGKLMLTMIGAINEFERANMLERQREGIAIAKQKGKYKGRRKKQIDIAFKCYYEKWKIREITATEFAKNMAMSRPTLYKLIEEYENTSVEIRK